jgi:hypothetical protein
LAGEATGDDVNSLGLLVFVTGEAPDVGVFGYVGPVLGQDATMMFFKLDLPAAFQSGTVEAEVKAADTTEERAVGHRDLSCWIRRNSAPAALRASMDDFAWPQV